MQKKQALTAEAWSALWLSVNPPPHAESLLVVWPGGWAKKTIWRLGRAAWQTVGHCRLQNILYYKMYERVTNLCNILNLTNIINMDSCEKVYLKSPLFTIINKHLLLTAPSTLKHSTTGFHVCLFLAWIGNDLNMKWQGSFLFQGNKTSLTLKI